MRRMFSVGLAAALALCVAGTASATTTIDLRFGGPPPTIGGPITVTLPSPGTVQMGVFLTTTDSLEAFSTTIFWNNSDTDALGNPTDPTIGPSVEWNGIDTGFGFVFVPIIPGPAGTFIDNSPLNLFVASFDGLQLGGTLVAGTYQLGTIVWQASAPGTTNIISGLITGLGGFFLLGGTDITGSVTFNGATINVVPEPGTASLLGLGLVGLILAGRRKRA